MSPQGPIEVGEVGACEALALAEEHKFGSGTVYLCYRPT